MIPFFIRTVSNIKAHIVPEQPENPGIFSKAKE